jgi:hypothetical protein
VSDGPREIGRVPYVAGFTPGGGAISRPLIVGYEDGKVTIGGAGEPWRLDADARELFQRLWMQAEFAVEAEGICPFAAVTDGGWSPCALRRGHEGGHAFRAPEQAAASGTGE